MDIKTLILIGGGVMIAAVVVHGFWIAWRARREPLRLNIVPDLIPDDYDEESRFRGELPNGGARVLTDPEQQPLPLDEPPMLMDTTGPVPALENEVDDELFGEPAANTVDTPQVQRSAASPSRSPAHRPAEGSDTTTARRPAVIERAAQDTAARPRVAEVRLEPELRKRRSRRAADNEPGVTGSEVQSPEELVVMYLLAGPGKKFHGPDLVGGLRAKGLRYGQMNIFHRLDPMSKVTQYSVANAVEPGVFDLSEVENMSSPGVTFFLRLPGPAQPIEAFDDMWRVARDLAVSLGGELKDDGQSVITAQTIEHYRERILEFSRRSMSRRA